MFAYNSIYFHVFKTMKVWFMNYKSL